MCIQTLLYWGYFRSNNSLRRQPSCRAPYVLFGHVLQEHWLWEIVYDNGCMTGRESLPGDALGCAIQRFACWYSCACIQVSCTWTSCWWDPLWEDYQLLDPNLKWYLDSVPGAITCFFFHVSCFILDEITCGRANLQLWSTGNWHSYTI